MDNTKKRLANIDLLKILAMLMIVCHHFLYHGGVLEKATLYDANYYVAWAFELLSIVGVNCFVLCSGYLMAENRFKFSKLIYLWLQIVFFSLADTILGLSFGSTELSFGTVCRTILPINFKSYWFMSAYFAFYILSPLLIWIVNKLTVNQLKKLVITLLVVFSVSPYQWTKIGSGYHVVWFCVLFFVAAYVRKADLFKKNAKTYFGYYLLFTLILLVIKLLVTIISAKHYSINVINVENYNFIFTFASSFMLFVAFKNISIKNARFAGFCTFLSPLTLGVYLVHDNSCVRDILWHKAVQPLLAFDKPYFVLYLLVCVLAVFFICAFIEYFRQLLFKLFNIPSLCDKLGGKVQAIADKVFEFDLNKL